VYHETGAGLKEWDEYRPHSLRDPGNFIRNRPSVKLCPIENRYFIPVELPTR